MPQAGGAPTPALPRPRRTVAADLVRGRVLLSSPVGDFLYWWDPRTGREVPGPNLHQLPHSLAISPDGRWLVVLGGSGGQDVLRADLARGDELERVYVLPADVSTRATTIDDRGHPIIAIDRWAGELWQVDAPPGHRW